MSEAHETTGTTSEPSAPTGAPARTTTTLGRNWLLKTTLFLVLLFGFGVWGLVDALHFYPRRGEMDASLKLARHLQAAQADASLTAGRLKSEDPRGELDSLRARAADIEQRLANPATQKSAQFEKTRMVWLEALALMWQLNNKPKYLGKDESTPPRKLYFKVADGEGEAVAADGTRTKLSPMDLLGKLAPKLNTSANVTPLSGLDMLFQWIFVFVGFGGGLYVLVSLVRAMGKRYSWDPTAKRLTLPDKSSVTPSDLKELDKRLWHKFYVTLLLKDGRSVTLDLLRYVPLEDWVLEMERTAFPESAAPAAEAAGEEARNEPPASPKA
ncbi:MAG: hypothetical protein ACK4WH_07300 [Phycisphaerales bacterium]